MSEHRDMLYASSFLSQDQQTPWIEITAQTVECTSLQQRGDLRETHETTTAMHHRVPLIPGTDSL